MKDIAVIGGGAAGYAAALSAKERFPGARVTVLEASQRTGRKILASGNGRCNLMNDGENVYFGDAAFADRVLENCTREDVRAFFDRAGLRIADESEEDGRVYPATGQAASVLDALRFYADRLGVRVLCEQKVTSVGYGKKGFRIDTETETYREDKVILACGSPAGGKLGMDSYSLLENMGHRIFAPQPALTPILCDMKGLGSLKGLRAPVRLLLCRQGKNGEKCVEMTEGEILFSETGVSGVCAMQLGRAAKPGDTLHIDFSPLLALCKRRHSHEIYPDVTPGENTGKVFALLKERAKQLDGDQMYAGLLPRVLAQVISQKGRNLHEQACLLSDFAVQVTGVKGLDTAQVAHGGADTKEFDPATMESRLHAGLYAAGEVLNVDGECGGFNLLFAWASGLIAGNAAAESLRAETEEK